MTSFRRKTCKNAKISRNIKKKKTAHKSNTIIKQKTVNSDSIQVHVSFKCTIQIKRTLLFSRILWKYENAIKLKKKKKLFGFYTDRRVLDVCNRKKIPTRKNNIEFFTV